MTGLTVRNRCHSRKRIGLGKNLLTRCDTTPLKETVEVL